MDGFSTGNTMEQYFHKWVSQVLEKIAFMKFVLCLLVKITLVKYLKQCLHCVNNWKAVMGPSECVIMT